MENDLEYQTIDSDFYSPLQSDALNDDPGMCKNESRFYRQYTKLKDDDEGLSGKYLTTLSWNYLYIEANLHYYCGL